jgi:transposase-like protein
VAAKVIRGHRGDSELLPLPLRALEAHKDKQPLERIMKEIRRRANVVGSFPEPLGPDARGGQAQAHSGHQVGAETYLKMDRIDEMMKEQEAA